MENASKALIIAGAILLAILIISLGIMVYNQAKSTVSDANLDSEEIQTINAKFTSYLGTQTGAKANSLLQAVIAENANNPNVSISVSCSNYATGSGDEYSVYDTTATVTVTATYGSSGLIDSITIQ